MSILTIDMIPSKELQGRRILIRVDARDDVRLSDSVPTLKLCSDSGGRVAVATHTGMPASGPSLDAVATRLSDLLGWSIRKLDDWKGESGLRAVTHLREGEIILLENLIFDAGEEANDERVAEELGQLAEIYCNDAFALAHEVRASTVAVAKRTKRAIAGIAFERDLTMLEAMQREPTHPALALLGGEVSKDKLLLAEEIVRRFDRTLIGGQLVLPFLIARELLLKSNSVTEEMVAIARRIMAGARDEKRDLGTPADFIVTDKSTVEQLSRDGVIPATPLRNVPENKLDPDLVIADIGTATRWAWSDWFGAARTIFWHGPMGISNIDLFCEGSRFLATELANRTWPTVHRTTVAGSALLRALRRLGFRIERLRHVTYAGRTALHYVAQRPLPAVDALAHTAARDMEPSRVLIPLNGSERDTVSVQAAAAAVAPNAKIFLLEVRPGLEEEQYPDLALGLSEAEKLERRVESERIFARANAILASHGLLSAAQRSVQGRPTKMILEYARKIRAELIVLTAEGTLGKLGAGRMVDRAPCATLVARQR
jgi:phosphoglycerate kinase